MGHVGKLAVRMQRVQCSKRPPWRLSDSGGAIRAGDGDASLATHAGVTTWGAHHGAMQQLRHRGSSQGAPSPKAPAPRPPPPEPELAALKEAVEDAWGTASEEEDRAEGWESLAPGYYIGVDLGTTNSVVALWHVTKSRVKVLKLRPEDGARIMPSAAYVDVDDQGNRTLLVGYAALERSAETGRRAITCSKRVLGLRYSDPALEALLDDLPITVVPDPSGSGGTAICVPGTERPAAGSGGGAHGAAAAAATGSGGAAMPAGSSGGESTGDDPSAVAAGGGDGGDEGGDEGDTVSPDEVCAAIMAELRLRAEAYASRGGSCAATGSEPITGCVVTVPVHFPEARRRAVRSAARSAGFFRAVTLAESTAAAMAYGLHVAGSKTVLTFDLGGGTLDVTVLALRDGGHFRVLSTAGDTHLGGEDMDQRLLNWALQEGVPKNAELSADAVARLRSACSAAKVALTEATSAEVTCSEPELSFRLRIERRKFQALTGDLVERARARVEAALEGAGVSADGIDEVVLAGGCSRIPSVRAMLQEVFPGKELCCAISPELAVAEGAAIRGAVLSGVPSKLLQDMLMLDALPMALAVKTADGALQVLLPKNALLPASATKTFALESPWQRGVTIEVVEIEHPAAAAPPPPPASHAVTPRQRVTDETAEIENETASDAYHGDSTGATAAAAQEAAGAHVFTFTFLLSKVQPGAVTAAAPPRTCDVTITMAADGVLRASVRDSWEPYAAAAGRRQLLLLGVYVVALAALYAYAKFAFAAQAGGEVGGPPH